MSSGGGLRVMGRSAIKKENEGTRGVHTQCQGGSTHQEEFGLSLEAASVSPADFLLSPNSFKVVGLKPH